MCGDPPTVSFDDRQQALLTVLDEWTSERDYATRVRNISGAGTGPRLNGDTFLTTGADGTVHDDDSPDLLIGGSGRDWFFFDPDRDWGLRRRDEVFADHIGNLLDRL